MSVDNFENIERILSRMNDYNDTKHDVLSTWCDAKNCAIELNAVRKNYGDLQPGLSKFSTALRDFAIEISRMHRTNRPEIDFNYNKIFYRYFKNCPLYCAIPLIITRDHNGDIDYMDSPERLSEELLDIARAFGDK